MGFEERRPEPADEQPSPIGSEDGLTGDEVGRPPEPGELADDPNAPAHTTTPEAGKRLPDYSA